MAQTNPEEKAKSMLEDMIKEAIDYLLTLLKKKKNP